MATADQILNQANSWLGLKESDGSHKKIIDVYNSHSPLARGYKVKYTDNWCATFISAVAIMCNATDIIPTECGAEEMVKLLKAKGCWQEDGNYVPKPGDIIFYDWDGKDTWSDHVGFVESVSGNSIKVIEGNKSDAVGYRNVTVGSSSIRGYGVINYSDTAAPNTPAPQPEPSKPAENSVNYKVKVNTKSGVNCRTEASTNGAKVTAYANGTELTITKESNGWGYANNTGWVSLQYCTKVSDSKALGTYEVTASDLIVRKKPGSDPVGYSGLTADGKKHDTDKDGAIQKGTRVTVMEWSGNWAHIPSGWVSGDYLKKV